MMIQNHQISLGFLARLLPMLACGLSSQIDDVVVGRSERLRIIICVTISVLVN
jgi:hypothetical protein